MIRDDRFLISRRPYAVDLTSLSTDPSQGGSYWWSTIDAAWFRRRQGVTVACVGTLRALQAWEPDSAEEFLSDYTDGRYGGRCEGRWDGTGYWGEEVPALQARHLELLRPMLANYPEIPAGHSGWWRF